MVGLYLRFTKNWQAFEKVTTDEWMRKRAGNFAFESMWKPMLDGKFGENWADKVNMAWMGARLHVRTTRLGNFVGEFQRFLGFGYRAIENDGADLRYNTAVEEIRKDPDGGLTVQFGQGQTERFDQVLVTLSPRAMTKLAPELPEDYLAGLLNLKHMGAFVLTISLTKPLSPDGYYWYNIPKKAGYPFLSLVEHTNFLKPEYFGGDHIIYIGDYLENDHLNFSKSKEELLAEFLPHLKRSILISMRVGSRSRG